MIKKLSIALFFAFVLQTNITQAQSEDAEYRQYLLSLIDLLQQQIVLLQAAASAPATPVTSTLKNFDSFLLEDVNDIEARYVIADARQVAGIQNNIHKEYFSRFFSVVPDAYDSYFVDLLVFDEENKDYDGYVETVAPYQEDTWRIAISEAMFDFSLTSEVVEELFVHEFAHIISYEGINGKPVSGRARCHEWFADFGCPPGDAYLLDFIDEFWRTSDLDQLVEEGGTEDLWTPQERQEQFVSEYASTDPSEDFAESFTFFVLEDLVEGNSLAADKVSYFYDFVELVDLRAEIRSNL